MQPGAFDQREPAAARWNFDVDGSEPPLERIGEVTSLVGGSRCPQRPAHLPIDPLSADAGFLSNVLFLPPFLIS